MKWKIDSFWVIAQKHSENFSEPLWDLENFQKIEKKFLVLYASRASETCAKKFWGRSKLCCKSYEAFFFAYCETPPGLWKISTNQKISPRVAYDNKSEKQISSIQYLETFIFNLWIWKKHWYPYKKPSAEKACPSLGRNYQSHDIITMPPLIIEWTLKEIISSVKARPSPIKNSITLIIICTELDNRGDEESRNKFFLLIYL